MIAGASPHSLAGREAASVGDVVAVPRKPPIPNVDQPVEPWQTENRIEGPRPPYLSRHIQINIGSGNQPAIRREQSNVGDQFFVRYLEPLRNPRLIQ